jgi:hypothetical protein
VPHAKKGNDLRSARKSRVLGLVSDGRVTGDRLPHCCNEAEGKKFRPACFTILVFPDDTTGIHSIRAFCGDKKVFNLFFGGKDKNRKSYEGVPVRRLANIYMDQTPTIAFL